MRISILAAFSFFVCGPSWASIGLFGDSGPRQTLICHDPVKLPASLDRLADSDRRKLWKSPAEFQKSQSPTTLLLNTLAGSFDASPLSSLDIVGFGKRRLIQLESLSLSPVQLKMYEKDLKKAGLDEGERLMLAVNPDYLIFRSDLMESVTADNLRVTLKQKDPALALLLASSTVLKNAEVTDLVDEIVSRYQADPVQIYGWNQAREAVADSPFANLVGSKFSVYVRADQRAAFILAGDGQHVAYCQPAESAPNAEAHLREWLTSKPVRDLVKSCGAEL